MKRRNSELFLWGVQVALALLLCAEILWRYPANHAGEQPCNFYVWAALGVLIVSLGAGLKQRYVPLGVIGTAMFLFFLVWLSDHNNLLVGYEKWIQRGMPRWGEITVPPVAEEEAER